MAEQRQNQQDVQDTPPDMKREDELLEVAEDAIQDMIMHERRRDQKYNTAGDDLDDEIDADIDGNAPKDQDLPNKKRGGNRGVSDWR